MDNIKIPQNISTKPTLSNGELYKTVVKILKTARSREYTILRNTSKKDYELKIKTEFKDFYEIYPNLFDMCIQNPTSFNMDKFKEMLNYKNKVDTGKINYNNASKEIGQKYFDEYVKPKISK